MLLAPLARIGARAVPAVGLAQRTTALLTCGSVGSIVLELLGRAGRGDAAERAGLLAAIGDGVIVTDGRDVLKVNRALCTLTGYDAQEIVGTTAPLPSWPVEYHASLMRSHAAAVAAGGGAIKRSCARTAARSLSRS